MAKTKIMVIQLKEIIYTAIFAALGVLLIILLIFMFSGNKKDKDDTSINSIYIPGIWTSSFELNNTTLDLEIIVDKSNITSIKLVNIDESITTMYPLIKPSLESISLQLYNNIPLEEVNLMEESSYTQIFLLNEIERLLEKARVVDE